MFATLEIKLNRTTVILWRGCEQLATRSWEAPAVCHSAQVSKWLREQGVSELEGVIWQECSPNQQSALPTDQTLWDLNRCLADLAGNLITEFGGEARKISALWEVELPEVARLSGLPEIQRRGVYDRVAHAAALAHLRPLLPTAERVVVASLDCGVSVAAQVGGRVLDVNNSWDGDGPMGLTRAGSLPTGDLIHWAFSSGLTLSECEEKITMAAGWRAYHEMMTETEWEKILAYQVAKEIGAMRAVLEQQVDAIVLTGELAGHSTLVREIASFLPQTIPLYVFPGKDGGWGLAEIWQESAQVQYRAGL